VLEISATCDAPIVEIERVITVDPGFSSKVLVVANSAAFGLPKKVVSVREAVAFLGFNSVRNIALTVGVFDFFVGKTDKESLRRREWWRHSVDTAVCAKWLAMETRRLRPDDAYTCGLLHLIGKTLLDRFGGHDYAEVASVKERAEVDDVEAERKVYGCDHTDVAVAITCKWGLPATLAAGLGYLTEPPDGEEYGVLRACTAVSAFVARTAKGTAPESETVPFWAMEQMMLHPDKMSSIVERGAQAIAESQLQF
jgi:HD-like signal output (HDOD) protein